MCRGAHVMPCICVHIRGQLVEVNSFLPSCGFCILNSGCHSLCRAWPPEFSACNLHIDGGERTASEESFDSDSDAVAACVTRELTSEAVSELLWIHTGLSFALTGEQYLNWEKIHRFKLEKQNICGAGIYVKHCIGEGRGELVGSIFLLPPRGFQGSDLATVFLFTVV